jgi:hypothetical protein
MDDGAASAGSVILFLVMLFIISGESIAILIASLRN